MSGMSSAGIRPVHGPTLKYAIVGALVIVVVYHFVAGKGRR